MNFHNLIDSTIHSSFIYVIKTEYIIYFLKFCQINRLFFFRIQLNYKGYYSEIYEKINEPVKKE